MVKLGACDLTSGIQGSRFSLLGINPKPYGIFGGSQAQGYCIDSPFLSCCSKEIELSCHNMDT